MNIYVSSTSSWRQGRQTCELDECHNPAILAWAPTTYTTYSRITTNPSTTTISPGLDTSRDVCIISSGIAGARESVIALLYSRDPATSPSPFRKPRSQVNPAGSLGPLIQGYVFLEDFNTTGASLHSGKRKRALGGQTDSPFQRSLHVIYQTIIQRTRKRKSGGRYTHVSQFIVAGEEAGS